MKGRSLFFCFEGAGRAERDRQTMTDACHHHFEMYVPVQNDDDANTDCMWYVYVTTSATSKQK